MTGICIGDYSIISSIGMAKEQFEASLMAGRHGISRLVNSSHHKASNAVGGEIPNAWLKDVDLDWAGDRLVAFSEYVFRDFETAAPIPLKDGAGLRIGILTASSYTGRQITVSSAEDYITNNGARIAPFSILKGMGNYASSKIAGKYKFNGISLCLDSACSTSLHAIGLAANLVSQGAQDLVFVLCVDTPLIPQSVLGWTRLGVLANGPEPGAACRPFSEDRTGTILGEGAVLLPVFRSSDAGRLGLLPALGILGYGFSNDFTHMAHTKSETMEAAMRMALHAEESRIPNIDYIGAHGTGTQVNDKNELLAIERVIGSQSGRLSVNSIKPYCGHTIAAAGGFSIAGLIAQTRSGLVFPNINLERPEKGFEGILPSGEAAPAKIKFSLVNSFALGGSCASLLFESLL